MVQLKKVTLQYIAIEDRIRMAAEPVDGEPVVFWLTQRLCNLLVGVLAAHLEHSEPESEVVERQAMLAFRQHDAGVRHLPAEPVRVVPAVTHAMLVPTIDILCSDKGVAVVLPGEGGNASLQMNRLELRQWMAALHRQYRQAGWPVSSWPSWIVSSGVGRN